VYPDAKNILTFFLDPNILYLYNLSECGIYYSVNQINDKKTLTDSSHYSISTILVALVHISRLPERFSK